MTYRQAYAINPDSGIRAEVIHMHRCPPDVAEPMALEDPCPRPLISCRECWDREIPTIPAASTAGTRLTIEIDGDDMHCNAARELKDIFFAALMAVHCAAEYLYNNATNPVTAEKPVWEMQNALKPTSGVWDFSHKKEAAKDDHSEPQR